MYSEDSTDVVIIAVVLPVFAAVAVALRFKARSITSMKYGADDWVMLAALITQLAQMGMNIYWAVDGGLGDSRKHLAENPHENDTYEKVLFVGPILFAITISMIKISILIFYNRVFPRRNFRVATYSVMVLVTAWLLTSISGTIAACVPFSRYLGPFYKRFDYPPFLLAMASINLALDLTLLMLPVFVVKTLQMSFKRKLLILGVFWLGAFCVVASAIRLYYFVLLTRGQDVITQNVIWSFIEPCFSIMAGCLPTLTPLFHKNQTLWSFIQSAKDAMSPRGSKQSGKSSNASMSEVRGIWDRTEPNDYARTKVSHGTTPIASDSELDSHIRIHQDFRVEHYAEV